MPSPAQYEFNREQNDILRRLGDAMRFIGGVVLLLAVLQAAGMVMAATKAMNQEEGWGSVITAAMAAIFLLAMGSLTFQAGSAFRAVATTAGRDITHLMQALDRMRKMFEMLSAIVMLWIVLAIVALVMSLATRQ